jgi:hypothetical protein
MIPVLVIPKIDPCSDQCLGLEFPGGSKGSSLVEVLASCGLGSGMTFPSVFAPVVV